MAFEILSQDEIDILINKNLNDVDSVITSRLAGSGMITSQMMSTAKTMLDRYYYTLTHCGYKEQCFARNNLRQAAFRIWLHRYGFNTRAGYIDFINKEAKKRGLNWKFLSL